jgi:hypothetical protein
MLPGRYIQFYQNVGQTILDVEHARSTDIQASEETEGLNASAQVLKALENLFVKPEQVIMTTKCILLARKSAEQGRTVAWHETESD